MRQNTILRLLSIVVIALFLAACTPGQVEIGMTETTRPGEWRADYTTFDGQKFAAMDLQPGQELSLDYQVEVEKGWLVLQVQAPDRDIVYAESYQSDAAEQIQLSVQQAGRYTIEITGQDTGGGWELNWQAR